MQEIYIYSTIDGWMKDKPDTTINGYVKNITNQFIEISDDKGFTQIINMDKLFAVVY